MLESATEELGLFWLKASEVKWTIECMPEFAGDDAEVDQEDVVVWEDEDASDPEASCAEGGADDNIADNVGECVKVEADARLLVAAAHFSICTGCNQTGPHALVAHEGVLESGSRFELSAVDVEVDSEACEEAMVRPEQQSWSGKGGNILMPTSWLERCKYLNSLAVLLPWR